MAKATSTKSGVSPTWEVVQGDNAHKTIFELASKYKMREQGKRGRISASAPFITDGLKPSPFRNEVGFRVIQPEELASLKVPTVGLTDGQIKGYQRHIKASHAFEIGWALRKGTTMPVIEVSLDEYGDAYLTDGQHRAIGAIIARVPLEAVIKQRSYNEAREMFVNQTFAKKLDRSHMTLVGTDLMSRYVQDALTNPNHPWHGLVSESGGSKITPAAMHRLVTMYGCNTVGALTPQLIEKVATRFDVARADSMAELISVFGTDGEGKFSTKNHPFAYRASNLSALGQASVHILIRADDVHPKADRERWLRHMPRFNWAGNAHIRSSGKMVDELIFHWNKNMTSRAIERRPFTKLDW